MLARDVKISTLVKLNREFTDEVFYWVGQLLEDRKQVAEAMEVRLIYAYERLRIDRKPEQGEENRETHWVIRSALHDIINQEPSDWKEASELFKKSLIENAYEETECGWLAIKFIGVSDTTARKLVDFHSMDKTPSNYKKRKPKPRKRNWWESKRKRK